MDNYKPCYLGDLRRIVLSDPSDSDSESIKSLRNTLSCMSGSPDGVQVSAPESIRSMIPVAVAAVSDPVETSATVDPAEPTPTAIVPVSDPVETSATVDPVESTPVAVEPSTVSDDLL